MVKPGVYTIDKKQLKNGEKTTEYLHVEVKPLPPKPTSTAKKGCTCMRIFSVFLFILVLVGIAVAFTFAIHWDDHPENNGHDCINCDEEWAPDMPPKGDHDGNDGDGGGHHGGPGDQDGDHDGHHGPGHNDGHHGGHGGGDHGGHHGGQDDHDGHGDDDDEPMPPIDYVGTPMPLLGRPDGHDDFPRGGFPGKDTAQLQGERDTHGRQYHPRFTGVEAWKQQRAMMKLPGYKNPEKSARRAQGRSRVEIEEEALERSPHDGKINGGRKRY